MNEFYACDAVRHLADMVQHELRNDELETADGIHQAICSLVQDILVGLDEDDVEDAQEMERVRHYYNWAGELMATYLRDGRIESSEEALVRLAAVK